MAVSQVGTLVSRQSIPPLAETSHDWSGASGPTCRERRARKDAMTAGWLHRSVLSSPCDAGPDGLPDTSVPDHTHAFWLGPDRGARSPPCISPDTRER